MPTETDDKHKVEFLYEELSHKVIELLIQVHKELGPYAREKQYADLFSKKLEEAGILYKRELRIGDSGNILDFLIADKIVLEFKAVPYLTREHYDQAKRYLFQTGLKLGIIVNFRERQVHPKRVLNISNLH